MVYSPPKGVEANISLPASHYFGMEDPTGQGARHIFLQQSEPCDWPDVLERLTRYFGLKISS